MTKLLSFSCGGGVGGYILTFHIFEALMLEIDNVTLSYSVQESNKLALKKTGMFFTFPVFLNV